MQLQKETTRDCFCNCNNVKVLEAVSNIHVVPIYIIKYIKNNLYLD